MVADSETTIFVVGANAESTRRASDYLGDSYRQTCCSDRPIAGVRRFPRINTGIQGRYLRLARILPKGSSSPCKSLLSCWRNLSDPFLQGYGHCVTYIFPDLLANVCAHRQFMRAITQSHERTPTGVAIDFAADLHQSPGFKKLDRNQSRRRRSSHAFEDSFLI